MKPLRIVFVLSVLILAASAANAQATRTWVSGVGDDVNPCSRTAPCKTFAGAISKTAAGGEISVLDPGGFGTITITKSITINGDGTLGSILSALAPQGVLVNAGVNDRVVLRNISINGAGTGTNGIRFIAGKSLVVDNVTIGGVTGRGIDVSLTNNGDVFVRNSHITKAATGVFATTTAGLARVTIENSSIVGMTTNGIEGGANSRILVSNSVISGNTSSGIFANSSTTRIGVNGSQVSFNNIAGINAAVAGSIVRLSDNDINNNIAGVTIAGGASVETAGNNRTAGNNATTPLGAPTITIE